MRVPLVCITLAVAVLMAATVAHAADDTALVDVTDLETIQQDIALGNAQSQSGYESLSDDVAALADSQRADSEKLDAITESQQADSEKLDAITESQQADSDKLDAITETQGEQVQMLQTIQLSVEQEPEPEQAEQVDVDTLLGLLPQDSPAFVADYMAHPFMWGIAAGSVGYLITLMQAAIYRLLGFR